MKIHVCGLHNVHSCIAKNDPALVVSITDPKYPKVSFATKAPVVSVQFEDTEHPNEREYSEMAHGVVHVLREVRGMITRDELKHDSTVVVHCHAGVSRSSAVAWLIMCMIQADFTEAFKSVYKGHPNIWPNTVVLGIGGIFLNYGDDFNRFVTQVDTEIGINRGPGQGYA